MRLLCVVVGLDGFDPDVLANLVLFYVACGLDVRISRVPMDCDLLVMQRGEYHGEVFEVRAQACHIYDYAGLGTSALHQAFPLIPSRLVITPRPGVSELSSQCTVVRSFHPVVPALWRADRKTLNARTPYDFVHIGHRKPNPDGDRCLEQLDSVARSGRCDFWGFGWEQLNKPHGKLHGAATLHETQRIYRQSACALGVMYPFQRGHTISGRMWQAPLSGCQLFSESVMSDVNLPGVYRCEDFEALLGSPPPPRHAALVEDCSDFWSDVTNKLAGMLGLKYAPPSKWTVSAVYAKWIYSRHVKRHIQNPTAVAVMAAMSARMIKAGRS